MPHLGYADLEELGPDGRIRPRTIGPGLNNGDLVRVYRGLLDDVILPGSTFREPFHPEAGRGRRNADDGQCGIAAIAALRDPALTIVIADTLLRWGGPDGTRDIQNAVRAVVGPQLAESPQVFVEGEGGAAPARDSTAYAGVINGTLNGARTRLRRSDPAFAARLPDTAGELSPTQWTQVLRDHLNEDLRRAGGVQAIEDIGNAAPDRGSREVGAVVVTMMLRDNGVSMTRRIQQSVNETLGRLRRNDAVRDSGTLPADLPVTGVFGAVTRDTITALLRAGHGDDLRISLLDAYDRYNRTRPEATARERINDTARIRWFQSLRLPS